MTASSETILWMGYIPLLVLASMAILKKLRNDRLIVIMLILSLCYALFGLIIKTTDNSSHDPFALAAFATPFIYVSTYALLRYIYKMIYKREPTYNRSSWYDYEEKRNQNLMDILVHLLPVFLSALLPLFFD